MVAIMNDTDPIDSALTPAWLALLAGRLVAQLREEGVPDPLGAPITLAALLFDLFSLNDALAPAEIRDRIGA